MISLSNRSQKTNVAGIFPELIIGLLVAKDVFAKYRQNLVIFDVKMLGKKIEIISSTIPYDTLQSIIHEIRSNLGPDFKISDDNSIKGLISMEFMISGVGK